MLGGGDKEAGDLTVNQGENVCCASHGKREKRGIEEKKGGTPGRAERLASRKGVQGRSRGREGAPNEKRRGKKRHSTGPQTKGTGKHEKRDSMVAKMQDQITRTAVNEVSKEGGGGDEKKETYGP